MAKNLLFTLTTKNRIYVKGHQNNKQTSRILTRPSVLKFLNLPLVLSSIFANFKQYDSFSYKVSFFRKMAFCTYLNDQL